MKKVGIISLILLFVASITYVLYLNFFKVDINFNETIKVEINTKYTINDFVVSIKNGKLLNKDEIVSFSNLGNNKITLL